MIGARNFDAAIAEEKRGGKCCADCSPGHAAARIDIALRDVMRETMAQSAALRFDAAALSIMDELSKDLPADLERYIQAEDNFESRKRQAAEAARRAAWKDPPSFHQGCLR
jgi:hypothetical protein